MFSTLVELFLNLDGAVVGVGGLSLAVSETLRQVAVLFSKGGYCVIALADACLVFFVDLDPPVY